MFDLKQPCVNCPFRKGQGQLYRLGEKRLLEIANAVSFQCHKTVEFYAEEEGPFINVDGEDFDEQWRPIKNMDHAQQCAGLMAILHHEGRPNQIMQVAQRLGQFDPEQLDPKNEAYETLRDALAAHRHESA